MGWSADFQVTLPSLPTTVTVAVTARTGNLMPASAQGELVLREAIRQGPADITPDGRLLVYATPKAEVGALTVRYTITGKEEQVPVWSFNKDWMGRRDDSWCCQFSKIMIRPVGKALTVSFGVGMGATLRQKPLSGDEVEQRVGVLRPDGRAVRTATFLVDINPSNGGSRDRVGLIGWKKGPLVEAKK